MRLHLDCDYFNKECESEYAPTNGDCENCYRWEVCVKAFFKGKKPIPIERLPEYVGKKVWVQTPGIPDYGREAIVEHVDVTKRILYLVKDFTCHSYGETWEAYPFDGSLPQSYDYDSVGSVH